MLSTRLVAFIGLLILTALGAAAALAQDYPNRSIRIITAPAGGSSDNVARTIAQGIIEGLGQPAVVDNRTNVAASEAVYKAPPDGYILLVSSESLWIRPLLEKVPYDLVKDFTPVGQVTREFYAVAVHTSLPVNSVRELIALAKAKPGALNYGSALSGSGTHLAAALFMSMAGVNIVQVAYKGIAQSITAVAGGEVNLMFANPSLLAPHAQAGKLRILAVSSAAPTALAPGVPTIAASGVPGYECVSIQGLFAPGKTPAAIINRLNQQIARVVNQPGAKERFLNIGSEVVGSTPEQFAAFIEVDNARMTKLVKDANIKAD